MKNKHKIDSGKIVRKHLREFFCLLGDLHFELFPTSVGEIHVNRAVLHPRIV